MAEFIHGRKLISALIEQGICDELTRRCVIDIPVNGIPTVYIEKVGDKALLEIVNNMPAPLEIKYGDLTNDD